MVKPEGLSSTASGIFHCMFLFKEKRFLFSFVWGGGARMLEKQHIRFTAWFFSFLFFFGKFNLQMKESY